MYFRPIGDPQWFNKENPAGTPAPLIDVGKCVVKDGKTSCTKTELPSLSTRLETLTGPNDLFKFWKKLSPILASVQSESIRKEL